MFKHHVASINNLMASLFGALFNCDTAEVYATAEDEYKKEYWVHGPDDKTGWFINPKELFIRHEIAPRLWANKHGILMYCPPDDEEVDYVIDRETALGAWGEDTIARCERAYEEVPWLRPGQELPAGCGLLNRMDDGMAAEMRQWWYNHQ